MIMSCWIGPTPDLSPIDHVGPLFWIIYGKSLEEWISEYFFIVRRLTHVSKMLIKVCQTAYKISLNTKYYILNDFK